MAKFGPRRRPPGVGEEQRRRPKEKWCRRREKGFWCLLAATSWHLRARLGGRGRLSTPGIGVGRELHVPHSQGCTSVHKRHICHPGGETGFQAAGGRARKRRGRIGRCLCGSELDIWNSLEEAAILGSCQRWRGWDTNQGWPWSDQDRGLCVHPGTPC